MREEDPVPASDPGVDPPSDWSLLPTRCVPSRVQVAGAAAEAKAGLRGPGQEVAVVMTSSQVLLPDPQLHLS